MKKKLNAILAEYVEDDSKRTILSLRIYEAVLEEWENKIKSIINNLTK